MVLLAVQSAQAQMDNMFYYPSKEWVPIENLKYEEVTLKTDTVQLSGIFLKPAKKPKATILFFHGSGGNVSKYIFMTKPLVENGYQVFMIDFRGYGKSTGTPTHLNIAQDGQVVLDYLLARPETKGTKVILYGASMGTQIAAKLARENQAKVNALVLDGALSSFTDIAADRSPENQRAMIRQFLTSPYSAKEDVKHIEKLPKLFIHSKDDQDVPYQEAQEVYANAKEPKQFLEYQGKHLEALKTNPQQVLEAIEKLIK